MDELDAELRARLDALPPVDLIAYVGQRCATLDDEYAVDALRPILDRRPCAG
jgi:hypothetical protein